MTLVLDRRDRQPGTRPPEAGMNTQRDFLLLVTLSVTAAAPAVAQMAAPIPDFSGWWNHASLNGLELPLSGPGPVRNKSRRLTGPQPGVGNRAQLSVNSRVPAVGKTKAANLDCGQPTLRANDMGPRRASDHSRSIDQQWRMVQLPWSGRYSINIGCPPLPWAQCLALLV
jgi:hypothetical protein